MGVTHPPAELQTLLRKKEQGSLRIVSEDVWRLSKCPAPGIVHPVLLPISCSGGFSMCTSFLVCTEGNYIHIIIRTGQAYIKIHLHICKRIFGISYKVDVSSICCALYNLETVPVGAEPVRSKSIRCCADRASNHLEPGSQRTKDKPS